MCRIRAGRLKGGPGDARHEHKNENEYAFSNDDISNIYNSYYVVDRHWSEERAKDASEAVFSSIYGSDYDRLADFSVSTKEEIQEIFDEAFSPESEKESFRELYDDRFLEIGYDMNSVSDEIFKSFSDADRAFLAGTKYEILEVTGNEDEYTVRAQITPFDLSQPVVKLNERISSEMGSISDINQYVDRFFSILIEEMNRTVEDHVYAEPFDFELHLKYDENKLYSVDADEFVFLVSIYGQDVGSQQN